MDLLTLPLTERHAALIQWPTTDEGWCAHFRRLDARYGTDPRSPLHHDNRCTANHEEGTCPSTIAARASA